MSSLNALANACRLFSSSYHLFTDTSIYLHPFEALEELMFLTIYSNLLADRFGV